MTLRDTLLDLLALAERHVRGYVTGENGEFFLRDFPMYRRAADHPDERQVLHALEKFLVVSRWYVNRHDELRAEVEPFIEIARANRERLGGSSLLVLLDEPW